jgi:hypothetical protein
MNEFMHATEHHAAPWPLWRKIAAYAVLSVLAMVSIWIVDRKVHRPAAGPASTLPSR